MKELNAKHTAFTTKASALCAADGADETATAALISAYHTHYESEDGPWTLGPDAYYDLLESHGIGHRQLRRWISEKAAGEAVKATAKGNRLFLALWAIESEAEDTTGFDGMSGHPPRDPDARVFG